MKHKTFFNWSGGKDSSLALYYLLKNENYSVESLLTTCSEEHQRITMHGIHVSLLDAQAKAIGIPLEKVYLPPQPEMSVYESSMNFAFKKYKYAQYTHTAYGDIFLEDLKRYRENQLEVFGLEPIFPIWQRKTTELIHEFIDLGFKAIVVCVNLDKLPSSFAGRIIDQAFIADLPPEVDPCGENGEFHTFVFDGPIFKTPLSIEKGKNVKKHYKSPIAEGQPLGFLFTDLKLKY